MKRKAVTVLIGGALMLGVCGSSAQAMTYSYTSEDGKTSMVTYYLNEDETGRQDVPAEDSTEEGGEDTETPGQYFEVGEFSEEGEDALTSEEEEKLSNWHKQEMRQHIAYLEKFGLSYNADRDVLMYQGKAVRWLIDEQIDNTCMAIQMPEGEIDVYTERAEDYEVTGLRVASQEEYDERTRKDEEAEAAAKEMEAAGEGAVFYTGEDGSVIHTFVYDEGTAIDDEIAADIGTAGEGAYTFVIEDDSSDIEGESGEIHVIVEGDALSQESDGGCTEAESGFSWSDDDVKSREKAMEYKEYGIGQSSTTGSWLWDGKEVHLLLDEDGSMYQNGSDEAVENKIYLLVKRNADGRIKEVKQMTVEEVMAERIAAEEAKDH